MKVTRLIREYVSNTISEAYSKKNNPYKESADADRKLIESFRKQLELDQENALRKFIIENEIVDTYRKCAYSAKTCIPSFHNFGTQAMIDEREWNAEQERIKKKKIDDVILSLELGANRAELDEMLKKIIDEIGR